MDGIESYRLKFGGFQKVLLIPETGYLRVRQILGDRRRGIPPIIPVASSTWWAGVKSGRFPQPVKLGPRTTVWRAEDIRSLVNNPAKK